MPWLQCPSSGAMKNEIMHLAANNQLNRNSESIGHLLRGFFEYFAQSGMLSSSHGKGFDWGRDVLSLRTPGGLLTKQEKGWTGAKTVFEVQGTGVPSNSRAGAPAQSSPAQSMEVGHDGQPKPRAVNSPKRGAGKSRRYGIDTFSPSRTRSSWTTMSLERLHTTASCPSAMSFAAHGE